MGSLMKNHSTTAPAIASTTMKKGRPSRRSSFASVSGPSARAAPPVTCASPIQARTSSGGRSGVAGLALAAVDPRAVDAGSFFVGAVLEPEPRAGVREARPFDLVLVAMPQRYGRRATVADRTRRVSAIGEPCRAAFRAGGCRDATPRGASQPSTRTMVSRPPRVSTTANPSER